MRREPVVVVLAVALVLAVAAGVGVSGYFAMLAQREAEAARRAEQQARVEQERAQEQARRAEQLLYASRLQLAQAAFAEGEAARALRQLDECRQEPRAWEHRHLPRFFEAWRPDGGRVVDPDPARP